jgi:hypothetical protein
MININVKDLQATELDLSTELEITELDLSDDSESYLEELFEQQLGIKGGGRITELVIY